VGKISKGFALNATWKIVWKEKHINVLQRSRVGILKRRFLKFNKLGIK